MKQSLAALILAAAVLGTACTPGLYKRNVEAQITGPATLAVGATAQLTGVLQYSDGTSLTVGPPLVGALVWQSSDTALATVSTSGVLTGRAPGTVTITATPSGGTGTGRLTAGTLRVTITQ